MMQIILKIISSEAWTAAQINGVFKGAEIDLKDGYIHFSTPEQVRDTARLHFAGRGNLMLLAVDARKLGAALKWEPSRGGAQFPHLYDVLNVNDVMWAEPLPWNGEAHEFPARLSS